MKTTILLLVSVFALFLVGTSAWADGPAVGLRISRTVSSFGGTAPQVEIDVSVTDTAFTWTSRSLSTVWIGNGWEAPDYRQFYMYESSSLLVPFPPAIDWGDGEYILRAPLFGSPSGPWTGSFSHTYPGSGSYLITAGDFRSTPEGGALVGTGNAIVGYGQYGGFYNATGTIFYEGSPSTFGASPWVVAITNTATVRVGFGIPAINLYGLIALALLLGGSGLALYRRPAAT